MEMPFHLVLSEKSKIFLDYLLNSLLPNSTSTGLSGLVSSDTKNNFFMFFGGKPDQRLRSFDLGFHTHLD